MTTEELIEKSPQISKILCKDCKHRSSKTKKCALTGYYVKRKGSCADAKR